MGCTELDQPGSEPFHGSRGQAGGSAADTGPDQALLGQGSDDQQIASELPTVQVIPP